MYLNTFVIQNLQISCIPTLKFFVQVLYTASSWKKRKERGLTKEYFGYVYSSVGREGIDVYRVSSYDVRFELTIDLIRLFPDFTKLSDFIVIKKDHDEFHMFMLDVVIGLIELAIEIDDGEFQYKVRPEIPRKEGGIAVDTKNGRNVFVVYKELFRYSIIEYLYDKNIEGYEIVNEHISYQKVVGLKVTDEFVLIQGLIHHQLIFSNSFKLQQNFGEIFYNSVRFCYIKNKIRKIVIFREVLIPLQTQSVLWAKQFFKNYNCFINSTENQSKPLKQMFLNEVNLILMEPINFRLIRKKIIRQMLMILDQVIQLKFFKLKFKRQTMKNFKQFEEKPKITFIKRHFYPNNQFRQQPIQSMFQKKKQSKKRVNFCSLTVVNPDTEPTIYTLFGVRDFMFFDQNITDYPLLKKFNITGFQYDDFFFGITGSGAFLVRYNFTPSGVKCYSNNETQILTQQSYLVKYNVTVALILMGFRKLEKVNDQPIHNLLMEKHSFYLNVQLSYPEPILQDELIKTLILVFVLLLVCLLALGCVEKVRQKHENEKFQSQPKSVEMMIQQNPFSKINQQLMSDDYKQKQERKKDKKKSQMQSQLI